MENTIYRIELDSVDDTRHLEFCIVDTNEVEPYRKIKEIGVTLLDDSSLYEGSLDNKELDSLINYLENCRNHIRKFNENSKPKE